MSINQLTGYLLAIHSALGEGLLLLSQLFSRGTV